MAQKNEIEEAKTLGYAYEIFKIDVMKVAEDIKALEKRGLVSEGWEEEMRDVKLRLHGLVDWIVERQKDAHHD